MRIGRVAGVLQRYGDRFTHRVFTQQELTDCGDRVESLAARWAAKEAAVKMLGTGIGQVAFQEIEVLRGPAGQPILALHGRAAALAAEQGLTQFALSLTHDSGLALAFVVAL